MLSPWALITTSPRKLIGASRGNDYLRFATTHCTFAKNMKRIVLVNGIIAGLIVSGLMIISHPLVADGTIGYDGGMVVGYASMVLALSMVFVGIKSYRDQVLNGVISFGQAFKVGILIALIASVMYAISWDVYYRVAASDFTQRYTEHYLEKMEEEGATQEEISSMRTEMEAFNTLYQNTFVRFGMTLLEILPVGLVITVLSASILKRRARSPGGVVGTR